ncbi:MAG: TPM domain-containing protein [Fimbriimonadales bacterium]|nr:TPM domain-containing protein [Fimbriimonadales bacterium]MDW8051456.1 TPM domain-containing protein [Armatimonadota bacterium]
MRRCLPVWVLTLCALWLSAPLPSWTQPLSQIPNPRQTHGGWVVDMAGVLSPQQQAQLNRLISALERETRAEVAVVILRRTEDATPKEYATELFNRWGVGKRGEDNGVLMLVSLGDRRVEIETGYGMEAIIPDAVAGEILDTVVIPRFRRGDIAGGVIAGVEAIAARIRRAQGLDAYAPILEDVPPAAQPTTPYLEIQTPLQSSRPTLSPTLVMTLLVVGGGVMVLLVWLLRERPPKCPSCQQPMQLLDENADDAYLNELQRTEERLGSVNYLVWKCESCNTLEMFRKVAWFSAYSECPKCGGHTLYETARIVREPTYTRRGLELISYTCKNPRCRYSHVQERVLPRLERVSLTWAIDAGDWLSGSSGGSRSSGGFFGGGGFGGGSFGGGSSGGGGAGRGW